jgi:hypothetical protein
MQLRSISCALSALVVATPLCFAQSEQPSAPTPQQVPSAPAPPGATGEPQFPPVNEANFDTTSPSKADVEAFLGLRCESVF